MASDTAVVFNILARDKASRVLSDFAQRANQAFNVAAVAVAGFAYQSIQTASDLEESQSKVKQIFGESADAVIEFSKGAAGSLGQSEQAALDGAATFALYGKAAGKTGQELVDFSTKLTILASDMASFSNTSPEEAIEAIGAAMRGENDQIEKYGVLINEAAIKSRALDMGLLKVTKSTAQVRAAQVAAKEAQSKYTEAVKEHGPKSFEAQKASAALGLAQERLATALEGTTGELTPQQRALAVQAEILAQTSVAQGDFARTSGSLANQQRILKAEFTNASAALGEELLPLALDLVTWLKGAVVWIKANKDEILHWGKIILIAGVTIKALNALITAWQTAVILVKGAIAAFTVVQKAANAAMLATPWAAAAAGALGLGYALGYAIDHSEELGITTMGAAHAIKKAKGESNFYASALKILNSEVVQGVAADIRYAESIDRVYKSTMDANRVAIAWEDALDGVTDSVAQNGRTLDINSAKGRANQTAIIAAAEAAWRQREAALASGKSLKDANKIYTDSINKLQAVGEKAGFSKRELNKLVGSYRLNVMLNFSAHGNALSALGSLGFGGVGAVLQGLSKINARARGGPVYAGQPYLVGEMGPELFLPSGSGRIVPNGATMAGLGSSGGTTVHLIIDTTGLVQGLRKEIRTQGGDVQLVLGQ